VSVAPGSYFFWATALLATAVASRVAIAMDLADLKVLWLNALWCIIVLPDVLADGSDQSIEGCFDEPSDQCHLTMHDRGGLATKGGVTKFAAAWKADRFRTRERSNSDQMTAAAMGHNAKASRES
jgi:hypothetical protein